MMLARADAVVPDAVVPDAVVPVAVAPDAVVRGPAADVLLMLWKRLPRFLTQSRSTATRQPSNASSQPRSPRDNSSRACRRLASRPSSPVLERRFVVVGGWWCREFLVFDRWADRGWCLGVDVASGHGPHERAGIGLLQMRKCAVKSVLEDVMSLAERAKVRFARPADGMFLRSGRVRRPRRVDRRF